MHDPPSSVRITCAAVFFPVSQTLGIALILRKKSTEVENDMTTYKEFQLVVQTFY